MVKKSRAKSKRKSRVAGRIKNFKKKVKSLFTAKNLKTWTKAGGRFLVWLIYDFSGIRFIWSKILPPKEKPERKPSTFLFWVFGIYVALYGITSQRYENRIDIIENRANSIYAQLSTPAYKKALSRISRVQNMPCPRKPYILKPVTVFTSLLGKEGRYEVMVELLKEIIENWKDKLIGVDLVMARLKWAKLRDAILRGANLRWADLYWADLIGSNLSGANLEGASLSMADLDRANLKGASLYRADFSGANLEGARGLTVEMLLEVETLYDVKGLDPKLMKELRAKKPELFEKPKELIED